MKKRYFKTAFIGLVVFLTIMACKKEKPSGYSNNNPTNSGSQPSNTILKAIAGEDIVLILPVNYCILNGSASYTDPIGKLFQTWKKISGPTGYSIVSPNSFKTKISNLDSGKYEFELTVTDQNGITNKDTVFVTVGSLPANPTEKIFNNLIWISGTIEIKNFDLMVPRGTVFKIYIQIGNSLNWQEVLPILSNPDDWGPPYEYFVKTKPDGAGMYNYGSLYIISYYENDVSDRPSVKIIY